MHSQPFPSIGAMPYPSSSQAVVAATPPLQLSPMPASSTVTNSNTEPSKTTTKRSPSWSYLEEETLIRIYEEVEGLKKKEKRDNVGH